MNKQAHIILIVCDLFGLWLLWIGYRDFHRIPSEIISQVDVIRFSNRLGFSIVGIAFPLFHAIALLGDLRKDFAKKYATVVNTGVYILLAVLIIGGIGGSYWVRSRVEKAGYVSCWQANGSGVITKTLAYTKDMEICEELIEEDRKESRRPPKKRVYYPSQLQ